MSDYHANTLTEKLEFDTVASTNTDVNVDEVVIDIVEYTA